MGKTKKVRQSQRKRNAAANARKKQQMRTSDAAGTKFLNPVFETPETKDPVTTAMTSMSDDNRASMVISNNTA